MKSGRNFLRNMAIVACLAVSLMFSACKKDGNDNNNVDGGKGGTLTITGLPAGPAYDVELFAGDTKLDTEIDRMYAMSGMLAHGGVPANGGNVFYLYQGMSSTTKWTGSATNVKVLLSESTLDSDFVNPKIAVAVTVANGTGTVNYSEFMPFGRGKNDSN